MNNPTSTPDTPDTPDQTVNTRFVMRAQTPPPRRRGGRPNLYLPKFAQIRDSNPEGQWVHVAHYQSVTGARDARKRIANGQMQIPAGLWEVQAVKDTENGTSDLYVRWFSDNQ